MADQTLPATLLLTYLRDSIKLACLAGQSSTASIMTAIDASGPDVEAAVTALLKDPAFLREVEHAREAMNETLVRWFKTRGPAYAKRMDELTKDDDPRVAFQATKDLLDRIGTRPEQRVAISGMQVWKGLLDELKPEEAEK